LRFQQGLKLGGYFDGQNVEIEYCWADNQADRQLALVADLPALRTQISRRDGA
jgi:hypothetical protein